MYLRVLEEAAPTLNLQVNGGGRRYSIRSFADSYREKRVRYFLTPADNCSMEDDEVVTMVKEAFSERRMEAVVGWESLFSLPAGHYVLKSQDLDYLQSTNVQSVIHESVLVAKNK